MKNLFWAFALATGVACAAHQSDASTLGIYDFQAASGTTLAATSVAAGFSFSDLVLVNSDNTVAAFSNHFYHTGWDSSLNSGKYYETTVSTTGSFEFTSIDFSMENTGSGSGQWELRTSLDGFSSGIASGTFSNGLVTDFGISGGLLGTISNSVTLRWLVASQQAGQRAGFATHLPGGLGGGLADVGQNLVFSGNAVTPIPLPAGLPLLISGLFGIFLLRRRCL